MTTWTYPAIVVKIVDADTIRLELDLGLHIWRTENCRIAGINAPELNTAEGQAAKAYAITLLPIDAEVLFESRQLDKYGRPLGRLTRDGVDYGQSLLDAGHAVVMKP